VVCVRRAALRIQQQGNGRCRESAASSAEFLLVSILMARISNEPELWVAGRTWSGPAVPCGKGRTSLAGK
jgi:hypothetical protein